VRTVPTKLKEIVAKLVFKDFMVMPETVVNACRVNAIIKLLHAMMKPDFASVA
jgi:hypothetical protein